MRLYLVCIYEYVNLHTKRKANEISWHDLYCFLMLDSRFWIHLFINCMEISRNSNTWNT